MQTHLLPLMQHHLIRFPMQEKQTCYFPELFSPLIAFLCFAHFTWAQRSRAPWFPSFKKETFGFPLVATISETRIFFVSTSLKLLFFNPLYERNKKTQDLNSAQRNLHCCGHNSKRTAGTGMCSVPTEVAEYKF
jgi:hypothetical protein